MTTSRSAHPRRGASSRWERAALGAGIAVLLLTVASQTGVLGPHDLTAVAAVGLVAAALCVGVAARSRGRAALLGLVLSLLPVALVVVYLAASDG